MTQYRTGDFENGIQNSQITDKLVDIKTQEIANNLLQIPKFKTLMDEDVGKACQFNTGGVDTLFPDVCMNKAVFSKPNQNIEVLKKEIKKQIMLKLTEMGASNNFNRNKTFNYYTNQYDYYYKKDLDLVCKEVYNDMTISYFDNEYVKFNKVASNPWNREHTKTKRQQFKNEENQTEKLTFSRTFNHIEDCFI